MENGFFRKNALLVENMYRVIDLIIISVGSLIGGYWKFGEVKPTPETLNVILMAIILGFFIFKKFGLYLPQRGKSIFSEILMVVSSVFSVLIVLSVVAFLTKTGAEISREWALVSTFIIVLLLIIVRVILRISLRLLRKSGKNSRNAVIYGAGKLGIEVCKKLDEENWTGLNVIGFFDDKVTGFEKIHNKKYLGNLESLVRLIEDERKGKIGVKKIDQVWVTLPLDHLSRLQNVIDELANSTIQVHFVPDWTAVNMFSRPLDQFAGITILNMSLKKISGPEYLVKEIFDKVFSAIILCVIWPILLVISILITLESRGPVLFKQKRYGVDGKEIIVWKFRTMKVLEDGKTINQVTRNDPRVTRIGKTLRKFSLDELPQFFNVLQGSMSVVGPRPHAVAHNEMYREKIPLYMSRHIVKPGITGWAQVNGWRGETDTYEKMQMRIQFDLEYIRNWSLFFDIKIIIKTILQLMKMQENY